MARIHDSNRNFGDLFDPIYDVGNRIVFHASRCVNYIWYQVYRLGTRPDNLYPMVLRYAVLSIIPIAFLASVPAQIILGKTGPAWLIWGAFLGALLIYLSSRVWNRGLRAYSSASS